MAALGDMQFSKPEVYPGHALHVISVMAVPDDIHHQFVQPELTKDAVSRGEQAVAPALLYVLVGQVVHTVAPLLEYVPVGQVMQVVAVVCPSR